MPRLTRLLPPAALAVIVYVPLLLTEPGVVVADTKSYLYLDPDRLLERAWSMWDPSIGTGTVTHQNIGYLWPMGPWFWVFDKLGVPDWVAQRLWLGTIIVLAGVGVAWMLRTLGWGDGGTDDAGRDGAAVWTAAFAYALTPYVLTVAARISVLLLPFAALPWLIGLTVRALRAGGWRWPALFALTVTTVGSVNLTALVLAGVGPVLWVLYALATRDVTPRRALAAIGRMGALTVPVSLWWLSGLWVQGGWGIDILKYTETAKVVAQASTANEVLRGLGYWFFYGGDKLGPWIEPSFTYTQKLLVLAVSYGIPIVALIGFAIVRFRHRAFAALLVLAGVVLAVGAHPWDDPTLEGKGIEAFLQSDYGLSMRSLPRAVPLVALGLAIGIAALVAAIGRRWTRLHWPAVIMVMAVTVCNVPPLWKLGMVPANLQRPESIPSYWTEAARYLDAQGDATRVLEIPGADFASYRWGNTVDPVLPGIMDRPYVARELIPYGSPPSSDLLIALDHRLQERILDPRALAVVARLLSAGDISVRSDLQYERYNTPRPKNLWQLVLAAPGLGTPVAFGEPVPNLPVPDASLYDQLYLQTAASLPDPPPVAEVPVLGALPIVRAQGASTLLVVAGDGEGLVDAAEAGLIDGTELALYSASDAGDPAALRDRAGSTAVLLVTDSNRRRGRRWTTVRHNAGYTTVAGEQPLTTDLTDNDLPVFGPAAGDDTMTVVAPRGGVTARATTYGNPVSFTPEDRAANAIDGDPTTGWLTAAFADAVGQRLELTLDQPTTTDHITLLQPTTEVINRSITSVRVRFDDGAPLTYPLGDASNVAPGERINFPSRTFSKVSIEIAADTAGRPPRFNGLSSEGFAEVTIGDAAPHIDEVLRPPTDLLDALGADSLAHPLTFLFTRQRSTPTDATRSDEELSLVREVDVPTARSFAVLGTARLSAWASDTMLDALIGGSSSIRATATSERLQGDRTSRGSAVVDGNPATAWTGRFDEGVGATLQLQSAAPITTDHITLTVRADGAHSVPTAVDVVADGRDLGPLRVPAITDGNVLGSNAAVSVALPGEISASSWQLRVTAVRSVETISWDSGQSTAFPVGIAEVGLGAPVTTTPAPAMFDSGCRADLLTLDDAPVSVRITGTTADALAGNALTVTACGQKPITTTVGAHVLRAAQGRTTGIDLDQLGLRSAAGGAADGSTAPLAQGDASVAAAPTVTITNDGRYQVKATVTGATPGQPFWLVLGQSYSSGWTASIPGIGGGKPHLVDGYANGWYVTPTTGSFTVSLTFAPQRTVNLMLELSGLAALVCIGLAGWPRRTRYPVADAPEIAFGVPRLGSTLAGADGWGRRGVVALACGVASAVIAGPVVGAVVAAFVLAATLGSRGRLALRLASPTFLAAAALYVLVQQVRHHTAPGLEWPGEVELAHPLGWLAVLLLASDVALSRFSRARDRT